MAERHWVGAGAAVWNATTSWSTVANGPNGASVPVAGDDVYIDKTLAGTATFLNCNQDIGAIASLRFPDVSPTAYVSTAVAGTAINNTGTTWNLPASVSIVVGPGTGVGGILNVATVGGTIVKTGSGVLYRTTATSTWGATNVDLQEGSLGVNSVNNALGSGTITMSVRYPRAEAGDRMSTQTTNVTKKFKVKLSKVNAWSSFRTFWWAGLGSSILLTLLAGWGFARLAARMKWDSPPDLVESLDTPPEDLPPDELERRREEARAAEEEQQRERKPWQR